MSIAVDWNEGDLSTRAMLVPPPPRLATPTCLLNCLINLFRGRTTELFTGNPKQLAGPQEQTLILSAEKLRSGDVNGGIKPAPRLITVC